MDIKSEQIDFAGAQIFLDQARKAFEAGDSNLCLAARKMVSIALLLTGEPRPVACTKHLTEG